MSKVTRNPVDGSVSALIHGDLIRVSGNNVADALATLLDEIARLEERVDQLERERKEVRERFYLTAAVLFCANFRSRFFLRAVLYAL